MKRHSDVVCAQPQQVTAGVAVLPEAQAEPRLRAPLPRPDLALKIPDRRAVVFVDPKNRNATLAVQHICRRHHYAVLLVEGGDGVARPNLTDAALQFLDIREEIPLVSFMHAGAENTPLWLMRANSQLGQMIGEQEYRALALADTPAPYRRSTTYSKTDAIGVLAHESFADDRLGRLDEMQAFRAPALIVGLDKQHAHTLINGLAATHMLFRGYTPGDYVSIMALAAGGSKPVVVYDPQHDKAQPLNFGSQATDPVLEKVIVVREPQKALDVIHMTTRVMPPPGGPVRPGRPRRGGVVHAAAKL